MACIMLGSVAFISMRKQKRLSASLFDQRKQGLQERPKQGPRRGGALREEKEEIECSRRLEMVPLVGTSASLAVI